MLLLSRLPILITAISTVVSSRSAEAQEPESSEAAADDPTALAKATQNPISDLISIPLQFNFNSGGGLGAESITNLNIQPVLPISVTPSWNVIARAIVPLLSVPGPRNVRDTGLGDLQLQLFAAPTGSKSLIWGLGPIFSIPTATVESSTTGSWGLGPAGVVVYLTGPWVLGVLATQTWTFADYGDDTDVNRLFVQPFINYNLGRGWAVSTAPSITANWDDAEAWTVPLGGGLTWTTKLGSQAMNLGVQYYYNVERPAASPQNQLRFVVAFLFPKHAPTKSPSVAQVVQ